MLSKKSRTTSTRFVPFRIFPSRKMELIAVKEVCFASFFFEKILTRFFFAVTVRDKSRELCELLSDPTMLQNEREFAR